MGTALSALADISIPHDNPVTIAALQLARVFYHHDMSERTVRFGVALADVPGIRHSRVEIVVTVAVRPIASDRRGIVYAGMVE